jgi:DNA-binding NarL/FixJ family response regulator
MARIHVAVVSDAPLLLLGLGAILRQDDQLLVIAEVREVSSLASAVRQRPCHVVLVHTATPALTASRLLGSLPALCPEAKVLLLTEQSGRAELLAALRLGVSGYAMLGTLAPEELCRGIVTLAQNGLWTCSAATRLLLREALLDDAAADGAAARAAQNGKVHSGLSDRELVVLRKAASGQGETQIARDLSVTTNTVKTYFHRICEKLQAPSRAEAIEAGIHLGLIPDGYHRGGATTALRPALTT